jgi:hypothetical protein
MRIETAEACFLTPMRQRTGDQIFGQSGRWLPAPHLKPRTSKFIGVHCCDAGKLRVEIDGSRLMGRLPTWD